ncbi:MAG: FtsQ-type POTRA domain-containing protein [Clostridium sp.]|uniref:cell division protein FtsQ/DivIB n=1 Tax=Clostridium sp. TaxID=1506 RepID=UPI0030624A7A
MAKNIKQSYGNYIIDNKESILRKKKRIIMIKKSILLLIVLMSILITLAFTLPNFNLSEITVTGIVNLSEESVKSSINIENDINIFKIRTNKIEKELLENPYILSSKVKRKYPNKISVNVEERKVVYYTEIGGGYYIIDDGGTVLEKKENIDGLNLLRLEGIEEAALKLGEPIQNIESEKLSALCNIYEFLEKNEFFTKYNIKKVEINDFIDMKIYVNEAYIKLGTAKDMNDKIAKAFSILSAPEMMDFKGYIDVSFDGNPVVYREE